MSLASSCSIEVMIAACQLEDHRIGSFNNLRLSLYEAERRFLFYGKAVQHPSRPWKCRLCKALYIVIRMIKVSHALLRLFFNSYPNLYWTLQRNTTEWNLMMKELSTAGNEIAKLMLQLLPASTPGAHIGQ